jgi:hypothetical protein
MSQLPAPKRCIFCQQELAGAYDAKLNPLGRAKEHAPPRWLQDHLHIRDVAVQHNHLGFGESERAVSESGEPFPSVVLRRDPRVAVLDANQLGTVCGTCNTGWMSRLEDAIGPTLRRLTGLSSITELDELDAPTRELLARWVLKTGVVMDAITNWKEFVPVEHGRALPNGGALPRGVALFGGMHSSACVYQADISQRWPTQCVYTEDELESGTQRSYRITLLLGKLMLLMVYWPLGEPWRFATWPGVHSVIWPPTLPTTSVPWTVPFPSNDCACLPVFDVALGISEGEWQSVAGRQGTGYLRHEEQLLHVTGELLSRVRCVDRISLDSGERCPCGSGVTFAKCHGREGSSPDPS